MKRIVAICKHGEHESWATKSLIDGLNLSGVSVIARGIAPHKKKPVPYPDGTIRAIALEIGEILESHLLIVHRSNLYVLRERFGSAFVDKLIAEGRLIVRGGRECQFTEKHTRCPRKLQRTLRQKISNALKGIPENPIRDIPEIGYLLKEKEY